MIALVVFTDGRGECLTKTLEAAEKHLKGPITEHVIIDDSGDEAYGTWLRMTSAIFYGNRWRIVSHDRRLGFGGTIASTWLYIARGTLAADCRFIFHLEDDFVLHRDVDLAAMAAVLDEHPHLVQLALRRQPWNELEQMAGGVIELHPEAYEEKSWHQPVWRSSVGDDTEVRRWLEHTLFFTTNPSLYRSSLCEHGWPLTDRSEGRFTHQLIAEDPGLRFGYWGARDSGEWVEHIGTERVGTGY